MEMQERQKATNTQDKCKTALWYLLLAVQHTLGILWATSDIAFVLAAFLLSSLEMFIRMENVIPGLLQDEKSKMQLL